MAIGFELPVVTLTPAACPFRASNGLVTSPLFILSCVTLSTDPLPSLVRSVSCGALSVTVCARPVAQEASPNSQQPIRCVAFVIGKGFNFCKCTKNMRNSPLFDRLYFGERDGWQRKVRRSETQRKEEKERENLLCPFVFQEDVYYNWILIDYYLLFPIETYYMIIYYNPPLLYFYHNLLLITKRYLLIKPINRLPLIRYLHYLFS